MKTVLWGLLLTGGLLGWAPVARAAAPQPTLLCPTAKAGQTSACGGGSVCAVPTKATDMVQVNGLGWEPYPTVTASASVYSCGTGGGWSTLPALGIPLYSSLAPPIAPPPPSNPAQVSVQLNWAAPTANTNGAPIASGELTGYNIYQGASATTLAKVATVAVPAHSWMSGALSPGTVFFAVTAVAGALESAQSAAVSATISAPAPATPGAPVSLTITVTGSLTQ
jgi:hypothetical protein